MLQIAQRLNRGRVFMGVFHAALRRPCSMKTTSPLGKGCTSGGFRSGSSNRRFQTGHDNP